MLSIFLSFSTLCLGKLGTEGKPWNIHNNSSNPKAKNICTNGQKLASAANTHVHTGLVSPIGANLVRTHMKNAAQKLQ